ncbi:hypothetical protein RRG08_052859, partial [Elysia crispata]
CSDIGSVFRLGIAGVGAVPGLELQGIAVSRSGTGLDWG